jgi:hypothetical protein
MQSTTQFSGKHRIAAGWTACRMTCPAGRVQRVVRGTKINPAMPGGPARGATT